MAIHIVVCIKSVVKSAPKGVARRTPENSELNPYDRPAIEAALQTREALGGSVTAVSMGPSVSSEVLAEARAMGVDNAVLVSDPALAESDTLATSLALAAAIRKLDGVDLLLFGTRTADSDTGQVGPQTAALMDMPFVSRIRNISPAADGLKIQRTMDAWDETWQMDLPGAGTVDPRGWQPRPVGLVGLSRVYEASDMIQWSAADLGLTPEQVGLAGSPTRVNRMERVKRSRRCDMLDGEPQDQVTALLSRLEEKGAIG